MEDWDLTLTVVGLGVASAAAVATLIDRFISGEWWWQRLGGQLSAQVQRQTETPTLTFSPYGETDTARKQAPPFEPPETFPASRVPHKYSVVDTP